MSKVIIGHQRSQVNFLINVDQYCFSVLQQSKLIPNINTTMWFTFQRGPFSTGMQKQIVIRFLFPRLPGSIFNVENGPGFRFQRGSIFNVTPATD